MRSTELAADVVLGNLEGTLSVGGELEVRRGKHQLLRVPDAAVIRRVAKRAGFTVMNVANNHAFDYGASGPGADARCARAQNLAMTGRPGTSPTSRSGRSRSRSSDSPRTPGRSG